ncbi:trigger factor [Aplysia californica]|uniref:Trigger factor n=1 Tax=Aplysia californica TaxID=6500 RepID=A0ABM1A1J9_APLCA|nr:trigger factor [Aplysia californica]
MAFSVSYKSMTDRDIKYTYSDQKISFVYPHRTSFRPLKEERPLPPLKKYPRRFYEYYPRFHIGIPRAPAFRGTDPDRVDRIVARICKPIECQKARRRDIQPEQTTHHVDNDNDDHDDDEDDDDDNNNNDDDANKNSRGSDTHRSDASNTSSRFTAKDISELTARLQKPTESSRQKAYLQRRQEDDREEANRSEIPPLAHVRRLPPISRRS